MASTAYSEAGSAMLTSEANPVTVRMGRELKRAPENVVTLFTVNPRPQFSTVKGSFFPGKEEGRRYTRLGTIPDPCYEIDDSLDNDRPAMNHYAVDGRWKAMDMLNPQRMSSLDMDAAETSENPEQRDNLISRGLFFIMRPYDARTGNENDEPNEAELKAAEGRLQRRYQALVRLFQQTNAATPGRLPDIMNDEMTDALNYAGIETPYTQTLKQKVECPNCGDQIPAKAKFHKSSLGYDCVIGGKSGWDAAVAAGFKKQSEVPKEFRDEAA